MEQESHQWIVHDHEEEEIEIEDDGALKRRQHVSHGKENLITDVVASFSSSSSLTSNGSEHRNGACSVVTEPDGSLAQKEGEDAEIGSVGENRNHVKGDKVDCEAVGVGLVAEFAGEVTNGEVIRLDYFLGRGKGVGLKFRNPAAAYGLLVWISY